MRAMQKVAIAGIRIGERKRSLDGTKVAELAASIAELGLLQPIGIRKDGTLVYGYHRLEACKRLGWTEIPAVIVDGDDLRAELAEIDENLIRAELTVLERAEQLLRRKEIYEQLYPEASSETVRIQKVMRNLKQFQDTDNYNASDAAHCAASERIPITPTPTFVQSTAAKTGLAERTVREHVQIAANLAPEVREQLRTSPIADNKTELLHLARLEPAEQRRVAEVLVRGEVDGVREAVRKLEIQALQAKAAQSPPQPPAGEYDVIVVDPPWPYGSVYDADGFRAASPYPEMSLEAIKAIRLPAARDSIVFLWTTHRFMRYAFEVLDAWGYREVAIITWVKDRMGLGTWLRSQSEFCIMAVRGQPKVCLTNQTTVVYGKLREHSRKPDEFYALVESLCPHARKLDYFAREPRAGWAVYGLEPEKFAREPHEFQGVCAGA